MATAACMADHFEKIQKLADPVPAAQTLEEFLATKFTAVANQQLLGLKHLLTKCAGIFILRMGQSFGSTCARNQRYILTENQSVQDHLPRLVSMQSLATLQERLQKLMRLSFSKCVRREQKKMVVRSK